MGAIVKYLHLCDDAALDRVIEAQEWCAGDFVADGGARCLAGHAADWTCRNGVYETRAMAVSDPDEADEGVAYLAFDRLARRFGLPRAVQLVKQRAAAVSDSRRPLPVMEPVEVSA